MRCELFILPRSWPSLVCYAHRRYYSKKQLFTRCKPVLGSTKIHTSAQKLKLQPHFIPNSISTLDNTKCHILLNDISAIHKLRTTLWQTEMRKEWLHPMHLHSHKTNVDSQFKETTTQNQYDNMLCVFLGEQTHRCDYKEFYNITWNEINNLLHWSRTLTETDKPVISTMPLNSWEPVPPATPAL